VNSEIVPESQGVDVGSLTISQTGLTQDQYAHLVTLLQQSSFTPPTSNTTSATTNRVISAHASSSTNAFAGINTIFSCSLHVKSPHWLIDSGANEHICSSIALLHSFYKIKLVHVTLPNGQSILVHYAGTVFFSPYFHIINVLYSPHFKVNLISVSKLLKLKTYDKHFVNDICTIQDVKSQKMIGLGDLCDGLYRLRMPPPSHSSHFSDNITTFPCNKVSSQSCNSVSCTSNIHIPSTALWHFRLGHLSNQRLSQMHQLYPTIHVDNKSTCDICHFAKPKKLPYTLSSSIASSKFELLHFDIWGPIAKVSIHGHIYFLTIVDDHGRFLWTIMLKNKSDVPSHIQNFIQLIQN